jgi:hypothetical protein
MGGLGKDLLLGGANGDFFVFANIADSSTTKTTRDVITDLEQGFDQIDVSYIDAIQGNGATNDQFDFIGTNKAFSGNAGELRSFWTADGQIVEGDVNGDGKADFSFEILDPTHTIVLSDADFIL